MRGLCEALGIVLVVAGLFVIWLPLGLIFTGVVLVLAAHAGPAPEVASGTSADLRGRAA